MMRVDDIAQTYNDSVLINEGFNDIVFANVSFERTNVQKCFIADDSK